MLSVIIPVFNEERNLPQLQAELTAALSTVGGYEIIYVDDGSSDKSLEVLSAIKVGHEEIKVMRLARHYGQTEALQAGIDYSCGEILVFLDADLQNDPKDIPRLLAKMSEGFDVVSGWRRKRYDPFFTRKVPSFLANLILSKVTKVKLNDLGCSLKAYRKDVLKKVRLYSEMHRLIPIYVARQGGVIAEIEVSHRRRVAGKSKYGLMRFFRVVLDFFVAEFMHSYLNRPMYVFGGYGMLLMFISFGIGMLIVVRKVFFDGVWVSPLLFIFVISFITAVQLILMGFIAEITIRIYYEGKRTYSVKTVL